MLLTSGQYKSSRVSTSRESIRLSIREWNLWKVDRCNGHHNYIYSITNLMHGFESATCTEVELLGFDANTMTNKCKLAIAGNHFIVFDNAF